MHRIPVKYTASAKFSFIKLITNYKVFKLRKSVSNETSQNKWLYVTKIGNIIAFVKVISEKKKRNSLQVENRRKQRINIGKTCFSTPKISFSYPSLRTPELIFLGKELWLMQF